MNKEEILIAIKDIQCRYSLPALKRNFTDKDYACLQYEKLAIHLANQQEKKDREIERLNNKLLKIGELINRTPRQTPKELAYVMLKGEIAEVIGADKK